MKSPYPADVLSPASLTEITGYDGPPCLSLYQPTHRRHPDNRQDPIRYRHLVKALETSLQQQHGADAVQALIEPFEALVDDADFWNHTLDGLAVLGAPGLFRVFRLPQHGTAWAERAVVADSFHTKPLRQWLQSAGRYQVLALSRNQVQLYEGDGHALDAVALALGGPQTVEAALGSERTEPHSTVAPSGGGSGGHPSTQHSHGSKKDEVDGDTERFFREVDRAVLEQHSRPSDLPLLLAALPEHHHLFRGLSQNRWLMADGLMVDPSGLAPDDLRQRAWDLAGPQQQAQQAAWCDAYGADAAKGLGSQDLAQIARAAVEGRVSVLLIEAERQVTGFIDGSTGRIDPAEPANPRADDVLDDLAALVEKRGGEVHVLPAERMPTNTGAAARFRH